MKSKTKIIAIFFVLAVFIIGPPLVLAQETPTSLQSFSGNQSDANTPLSPGGGGSSNGVPTPTSPTPTTSPATSPVTNPATTPTTTPTTSTSTGGIVPCGNGASSPCTLCHLVQGIYNLVQWGLNIVIVAAIVAISIAGIVYIVSAGSEKLMSQAKAFARAAIAGFAIAVAAWLIVNVVIQVLGFSGGGLGITGWNSISCSTSSSALSGGTGTGSLTSAQQQQVQQQLQDCNNWCNSNQGDPNTQAGQAYNTSCLSGCAQNYQASVAAAQQATNNGTSNQYAQNQTDCANYCGSGGTIDLGTDYATCNSTCMAAKSGQNNQTTTGTQLSSTDAASRLDACGVGYANTNTLNGIQDVAVSEMCNFSNASGCNTQITSGTSGSHALGSDCTHSSGCKFDFAPNSCNDAWIQNNYPNTGTRSDGAACYSAPDGACYAREGNHWDMSSTRSCKAQGC